MDHGGWRLNGRPGLRMAVWSQVKSRGRCTPALSVIQQRRCSCSCRLWRYKCYAFYLFNMHIRWLELSWCVMLQLKHCQAKDLHQSSLLSWSHKKSWLASQWPCSVMSLARQHLTSRGTRSELMSVRSFDWLVYRFAFSGTLSQIRPCHVIVNVIICY